MAPPKRDSSDAQGMRAISSFFAPKTRLVATQMVHLVIMGDFFYFYLRSVGRGMPIQLPTAAGMV
mgnify:CR=1 FL=1